MKKTINKLLSMGVVIEDPEAIGTSLKGLVNDALQLSEEARRSAINGDFLNAAIALSQATELHDMYMTIVRKAGDILPVEFEEITVSFGNIFKHDSNIIKDAAG